MTEVPHEHAVFLGSTRDVVPEGIGFALRSEDEERTLPRRERVMPCQLKEQLFGLHVPHLSAAEALRTSTLSG